MSQGRLLPLGGREANEKALITGMRGVRRANDIPVGGVMSIVSLLLSYNLKNRLKAKPAHPHKCAGLYAETFSLSTLVTKYSIHLALEVNKIVMAKMRMD